MWHLIGLQGLCLGIDAAGAGAVLRDLQTAITGIAANKKLVKQEGIQAGEQVVVAHATTTLETLDKLSRQQGFENNPDIQVASEILIKVKKGRALTDDELGTLFKAAENLQKKQLPVINEAVAFDIKKAVQSSGKMTPEMEKAIEAKYRDLGLDLDLDGTSFSITTVGTTASDPVQTFTDSATINKGVEQGPPTYEATNQADTSFWTDTRYEYLAQNPSYFIRPEGGIHIKGAKDDPTRTTESIQQMQVGDQTLPVPTLQQAILDDFKQARAKFAGPEDLQAAAKAGFGVELPLDEAKVLYNFIQHGKADPQGPAPTSDDVRTLQALLAKLGGKFEGAVKENGGFDGLYGYATTKEVRLLTARLDQVQKQEPKPVTEQVAITGFQEQIPLKTWEPSKDASYVVDTSGSMSDTARNLFNLIDGRLRLRGKESAEKHVLGTFAGGESTIALNATPQAPTAAARVAQIDKTMGEALALVAGQPPTAAGLQQLAGLMHVDAKALEGCVENGHINVTKFRALVKDPSNDGQEAGLKAALLTLMADPLYAAPAPDGKARELCIVTDEPEHEPQYLELVQHLAAQKGVSVKIIALPTTMAADGNAAQIGALQKQLDEAVLHLQEVRGRKPPATASVIQSNERKIEHLQAGIARLGIKVIDLSTLDNDYVREHVTTGSSGLPEFKWTDSQQTMGTDLLR